MIGNSNIPWLPAPRTLPREPHRKNTPRNISPSPLAFLVFSKRQTKVWQLPTARPSRARSPIPASLLAVADDDYVKPADSQFGRYRTWHELPISVAIDPLRTSARAKKKNNDILLKVLPEGFSSNRYGKGRRLWRCRNWKIYASDAFEGLARNC